MEQYLIFNSLNYPILTVLVAVPLIGSLITLFIRGDRYLKIWGLMVTLITAVLSLPLYSNFDLTTAKY
jgi:NADH-quinone oxidoreductase subunit M